jgi:ABC-type Na+ transport system ATPase subunit NatA
MRMLTTLTRPTSGTARVAGASIEEREAVTPHVGYLPEQPPVYDELTGREQLEYVAGLRDIPGERASQRIAELLKRFDLAGDADKRIDAYSRGGYVRRPASSRQCYTSQRSSFSMSPPAAWTLGPPARCGTPSRVSPTRR